MTKKFTIEEIDNGIYQIQETWFKEHANLYLFRGSKSNLLIDCGLGMFDLKEFLAGYGFAHIQIALTHSHFDHAGGLKHFQRGKNFITPIINKNLQNPKSWGLKYLNNKDFLIQLPAKFAIIEQLRKGYKLFSTKDKPWRGKQIDIGGFVFDLISLPGHTDDSVAYLEKEKGILVTGDTLYDGEIYFDFVNSNKKDFKESLASIIKTDFKKVLPGHNQIFSRAKALKIAQRWMRLCD